MMILINGGSSSGKSAFAETLIVEQAKKEEVMAEAAGKLMRGGARKTDMRHQPSCYLATMIAWDEECRERIRKHRNIAVVPEHIIAGAGKTRVNQLYPLTGRRTLGMVPGAERVIQNILLSDTKNI